MSPLPFLILILIVGAATPAVAIGDKNNDPQSPVDFGTLVYPEYKTCPAGNETYVFITNKVCHPSLNLSFLC